MARTMRGWKLGLLCAAVLLTATISTSVLAQGGGGGGQRGQRGGFGGPPSVTNLPVAYLAFALGLNDDQVTKIKAAQDKANTDRRALFQDSAGGPPDQEKMKAINDQAKTDIEAVLTEPQKGKVEGAVKDAGIYRGVGLRLEVIPDLKLTSDEKTKLAELAEAAAKEMQPIMKDMAEARQAGDRDKSRELRQKMQDAQKATHEKALAMLTDEQKATIDKYDKDHPLPT